MATNEKTAEQTVNMPDRVAVIAVHGVGEHSPGETSALVTKQLLSLPGNPYTSAKMESWALDVDSNGLYPPGSVVLPSSPPSPGHWERLKRGFQSAFLNRVNQLAGGIGQMNSDQRFTSSLLMEGQNYQSVYTTSRQSLLRRGPSGIESHVDIYDMYWSDLSHGGVTGGRKIFEQFSQLLLHVASLGRTTLATVVESLPANHKSAADWKATYHLSAAAYWCLSMPILQGNLLFLLLALLTVPALVPQAMLAPIIAVVTGLGTAIGVGKAGFSRMSAPTGRKASGWLVILSLLAGLVAGTLAWLTCKHWTVDLGWALTFIESAALFVPAWFWMARHDQSRPGTLPLWGAFMLGFILLAAVALYSVPTNIAVGQTVCGASSVANCAASCAGDCSASCKISCSITGLPANSASSHILVWLAYVSEGVFLTLAVFWAILFAVNLFLLGRSGHLYLRTEKSDSRQRALGTALMAAAVPPPLLLSIILLAWTLGYAIFKSVLPTVSFTPWWHELFPGTGNIADFVCALIEKSATVAMLPYLGMMLLAMLLLLWAVLPSIKAELFPPKAIQAMASGGASQSLGNWLDGGFVAIGMALVLAGIGFFAVLPVGLVIQYVAPSTFENTSWVALVGALVGGGASTFLAGTKAFGKSFSEFFSRLRVVVDAALDVDNWLRERPRGNTPRLRIFARYNALLKWIRSGHYQKIVVVAHSQGTVVSTEFFRYLKQQMPKQHSDLPPVSLFTVGCPLHQLYALRFPVLYAWVGRDTIPAGPNPAQCGFEKWVNAYGSGDYVGRFLWSASTDPARWNPSTFGGQPIGSVEFCIGAYAHTHYFDAGNLPVADCIDALIR